MDTKILLKDQLLNKQRVEKIAEEIQQAYPKFDKTNFVERVVSQFPNLELTPRVKWISENFKIFLPDDYRQAVAVLLKSLPAKINNDFGEYTYAAYSDFVAKYGLEKINLQFSLNALKEMTKIFSAEDAIRYFINAFPKETMEEIEKWSKDSDYRVRRLASEGTRPRLPWSQKINTKPIDALSILDNLFSDKNRFVTRSVANHLNDISKIDPELVLKTLKKWQQSEKQTEKEMQYIVDHSLRSLIKQGHKDTFKFLNHSENPEVEVSRFEIKSNNIKIGESLEFSFTLTAKKDEQLIIDYIIYFHNKTGTGQNKKVFKLKKITMIKNQKLVINKKQPMKNMSTRKLYLGKHKIEIQINGKKLAEEIFDLL